jgi:hypothetical protein
MKSRGRYGSEMNSIVLKNKISRDASLETLQKPKRKELDFLEINHQNQRIKDALESRTSDIPHYSARRSARNST